MLLDPVGPEGGPCPIGRRHGPPCGGAPRAPAWWSAPSAVRAVPASFSEGGAMEAQAHVDALVRSAARCACGGAVPIG
jgi:hypothetical protein